MNKSLLSFFIFTFISSISLNAYTLESYLGFAMNDRNINPENTVKSSSPLGIFGTDLKFNNTNNFYSIGYRHISSIPQINENRGINEFLFLKNYKGLYAGIALHIEPLTGKYYTEQIGKYSGILGYKLEFKDKDLFIEFRKTKNKDMILLGAKFNFDISEAKIFK